MPTRTVNVPKSFHGKVIGKRAATKLDIESDYGVTLTMPDRTSTSDAIVIEGPTKASLDAAEARILDICGLGQDMNDVKSEFNHKCAQRDKAFEEAKSLPQGPIRDAAFIRANLLKSECDALSLEAAKKIFATKNLGYGLDQMDLHGLTVKEAEYFVNERLEKVRDMVGKNGFELSIITGFGHHSENQVAKIKPAILSLLTGQGFRTRLDDSEGIILVDGFVGGPPKQASSKRDELSLFWDMITDLLWCCWKR